jgi:peptide/nickel transport system permease protein
MLAYVIRRLIQSLIVLLIVMLFTFTLPYFQTGGIDAPAYAVLGTHANATTVAHWGLVNGMDHPYVVRFWNYLVQVFGHFNLGRSYKQNLSVWNIISLYVPRTLWLALGALVFTVAIGIPLGIYQASRRNSTVDYTATGVAFVLYAMPLFLLCLLMLQAFSFSWPHLPSSPPSGVAPWAIFTDPVGFILPVACLTMVQVASLSRFMRGTVLEVLVQDYIRTAKAKGCSGPRVLFRHAMRNALGPIVTILGLSLPALLGGALIVASRVMPSTVGMSKLEAALTV